MTIYCRRRWISNRSATRQRSHREECIILLHLFFFFQAEDGIRDRTVTGVQTCALPISEPAGTSASATLPAGSVDVTFGHTVSATSIFQLKLDKVVFLTTPPAPDPQASPRSEERRVGKEGRSRGAADE